MSEQATRSRRRRTGGLDLTMVLAVLVPLVGVVSLLLVRPGPAPEVLVRPPTQSELTRASLVCPSADGPVSVGTAGGARGSVSVRVGREDRTVAVRPDRLGVVSGLGGGPAEITGVDEVAPGLVAGRFPLEGAPSAPECRAPAAEQWFTGVGAAARHASTLELVNPDGGPAVVDVVVQGRRGEVDAPSLRGVSVPGNGTVRLDLAEVVPRRGDLALHVTTSRGRVAAFVLDRVDELGAGASAEDWLGSQQEPASSALVLGIARGEGRRQLVLANATEDEARVSLGVVTDDAVFAPEGVEEIVVPPRGVTRVGLGSTLTAQALQDGVGLMVEASRPVTASVRSFVDGDLSLAVAGEPLAADVTESVVPPGQATLVLAGADSVGVAVVTALDADGGVLDEQDGQRVELRPERAVSVDLPEGTRLLRLRLRGTGAVASLVVDDESGAAFVRLRDLETSGLVADVRPARR